MMQHSQSSRTKPTKIATPLTSMKRQRKKQPHYNTKFNFPKHLKVIPLVIDSSGRWNGGLHEFVKKIARHTAGPDNFKYNKNLTRMRNNTLAIDHAKAVAGRIAYLQQETYRSR